MKEVSEVEIARRFEQNPLLTPENIKPSGKDMVVECLLNPGVFRFNKKIWLLMRVAERPEQTEGYISIARRLAGDMHNRLLSVRRLSLVLITLSLGALVLAGPPELPFRPDVIVAQDGSGEFRTIQAALESIPRDNHERRIVLVDRRHLLDGRHDGAEVVVCHHVLKRRRALLTLQQEGSFRWTAACASDWRTRTPDWPQTRYEAKALREGRRCYYLRFRRA
jgi:hypothetical protein